jgi:hypothetical protein
MAQKIGRNGSCHHPVAQINWAVKSYDCGRDYLDKTAFKGQSRTFGTSFSINSVSL